MKFCAKCGRKEETKEGLCKRCYLDAHLLTDMPEKVILKICCGCSKVFHRNKWSRYESFEEAVRSIVRENIKTKEKIDIKPIIKEEKTEAEIKVSSSGERYVIPVQIEEITCSKCGRNTGKYFEGVLQLRNVDKEVIDYVLKDINEKQTEGVFIQEAKETKNGIDLKLTSQRYIRAIGKKLKKRFGGSLKTTGKLFTRDKQTSKEVYRVTALYKQKD